MYKKQVGSDYSECRDESSGTTSELSVQKCHSEDFVQNRFQVSATKMKKNTTHLKYPIIQEQQRQANTGFINQEAQPLQRHRMMHHVN